VDLIGKVKVGKLAVSVRGVVTESPLINREEAGTINLENSIVTALSHTIGQCDIDGDGKVVTWHIVVPFIPGVSISNGDK